MLGRQWRERSDSNTSAESVELRGNILEVHQGQPVAGEDAESVFLDDGAAPGRGGYVVEMPPQRESQRLINNALRRQPPRGDLGLLPYRSALLSLGGQTAMSTHFPNTPAGTSALQRMQSLFRAGQQGGQPRHARPANEATFTTVDLHQRTRRHHRPGQPQQQQQQLHDAQAAALSKAPSTSPSGAAPATPPRELQSTAQGCASNSGSSFSPSQARTSPSPMHSRPDHGPGNSGAVGPTTRRLAYFAILHSLARDYIAVRHALRCHDGEMYPAGPAAASSSSNGTAPAPAPAVAPQTSVAAPSTVLRQLSMAETHSLLTQRLEQLGKRATRVLSYLWYGDGDGFRGLQSDMTPLLDCTSGDGGGGGTNSSAGEIYYRWMEELCVLLEALFRVGDLNNPS